MIELTLLSARARIRAYSAQPLNLVLELLYVAIILFVIIAAGHAQDLGTLRAAISGYLIWLLFGMVCMSGVEWLNGHIASGRLERLFSGPRPHLHQVFAEIIASGTIGVVRATLAGALILALFRIPMPGVAASLAVIVLQSLSFFGIALMLAGLSLRWRALQYGFSLFQIALLVFTSASTAIVAAVGGAAVWIPITNGIGVFSGQLSVSAATFGPMCVLAAASVVLGALTFVYFDERLFRTCRMFSL
ncbi:MAG TPA: hypothetical protein VGC72_12700 [Candidatus Elarobacter sp.]